MDQKFQQWIDKAPKWSDLPDEQKTSMLSVMKTIFPDPAVDMKEGIPSHISALVYDVYDD